MSVLIDGRELTISKHALERYAERVKPHLPLGEACAELERMLALAGRRVARPSWALTVAETEFWIELGDGIAFPALNGNLMTCITRSFPSDEARQARAEERRRKDADGFSPKRRKQHGKVQRGERVRARRRLEAADG